MKVVDRNENRQTNIELLRLLLMFMILMHHFLVHGLHTAGFSEDYDAELLATALDPFFFVGVNCFVMISGFFGIKLKFSGLYKLFVQCAFYGLIFYFFHLVVDGNHIGKSLINNCLTVFSTPPGWWFIRVYIYLYLSSPLLNAVIDKLSKRRFIYFLVLLGILNVYFGYLRQTPINPSGYTLSNFIFLYFIGRYLKLHVHYEKHSCAFWLMLYLAASMVMGAIASVNTFCLHSHSMLLNVHVYNNPLLILSAVFLLLTFVRLSVPYSKNLNWLAYSALAIYLITENCYSSQHYYPYVATMVQGHNEVVSWLLLVGIALLSMICCLLFDKIRIGIMQPIDRFMIKRLAQLDNRLELWLEQ